MSSTESHNSGLARSPDLPARLTLALGEGRPPARDQEFAPELSYGRHFGPAPATARAAAVVALLYPRDGRWHIPLIERPDTLRHGGQISMPGGGVEAGESSADCARRELFEELGVSESVELLGRLSDCYVYVSDFLVAPWLAATRQVPVWRPHSDEVAHVIELPLDVLRDERAICATTIQRGPVVFSARGYTWEGHCIWGATALILSELAAILSTLEAPA